mgnify:CR=1 FL=1|jgi:hypothetical protein
MSASYKGWVKLYQKNPDVAMMHNKANEFLQQYKQDQKKDMGVQDKNKKFFGLF